MRSYINASYAVSFNLNNLVSCCVGVVETISDTSIICRKLSQCMCSLPQPMVEWWWSGVIMLWQGWGSSSHVYILRMIVTYRSLNKSRLTGTHWLYNICYDWLVHFHVISHIHKFFKSNFSREKGIIFQIISLKYHCQYKTT